MTNKTLSARLYSRSSPELCHFWSLLQCDFSAIARHIFPKPWMKATQHVLRRSKRILNPVTVYWLISMSFLLWVNTENWLSLELKKWHKGVIWMESAAMPMCVVKVDHVNHQSATPAAPGTRAILSIYHHGNTAGCICSHVDDMPPPCHVTRFPFLPVSASKSEYDNLRAKSSTAFTPAGDKHHDAFRESIRDAPEALPMPASISPSAHSVVAQLHRLSHLFRLVTHWITVVTRIKDHNREILK